MNFLAKSTSSLAFCGEDQNEDENDNQNQIMMSTASRFKLHFSSNSSSSSPTSSTQPHKSLVPLDFHHHHKQNRGSWLENKFEAPPQPSPEEITSLRCYIGGAGKLELMDASPDATTGNSNAGENDAARFAPSSANDDNDIRRGGGSDVLGLGGGGIATAGTSTVGVVVERVHMFDKVVTPSDVGKLNRLVIPKQHAEKYFPLDSSTNEKCLLLNFEDRNGKPWRFRYSYWNSSQSYVMTKGWSRFVKEKKLDAGDIVSFQRGVGELGEDRLFIDWRRRPDAPDLFAPCFLTLSQSHLPQQHYYSFPHHHRSTLTQPWSPLFLQQPQATAAPTTRPDNSPFPLFQAQPNIINYQPHSNSYSGYSYSNSGHYGTYNTNVVSPCSSSVIYLRSEAAAPQQAGMVQLQQIGGGCGNSGVEVEPMVFDSVPVVHGKAALKRLRLFGVNMDCPISESDECDFLSSSTTTTIAPHPLHLSSSPIPPLRLRLYNGIGNPLPMPAMQSNLLDKARTSNV